ncbi:MAG TPA: four helix bundle protein [Candidatus Acidoferrum sp.]|nr:four helix bundle protein [Candidatus Acidoferrum sp.]
MKNGVKDFTQLDAWKMARQLRSEIYKASKIFPRDETYALISQMRRSAISVTANFAEGYLRYSVQENIQFCRQCRASAYELRDHCTAALDSGYISKKVFDELNALGISVIKLLNGYIRATMTGQQNAKKST